MGLYNTIDVHCPSCGTIHDLQSKGGSCQLVTYKERSVPLGDAAYIHGSIIKCSNCHSSFLVESEATRVRLNTRVVNFDDLD